MLDHQSAKCEQVFHLYLELITWLSVAKNMISPVLSQRWAIETTQITRCNGWPMRRALFVIGLLLPSLTSAKIAISEVLWAGSPVSTADEWLEIVNSSSETVALDGWTITKRSSDGSDTEMIRFLEDIEIGAGEYLLIANYSADNSALSVSPDIVSTAVSLANTKLFLQLLDAEGEVVDTVDDGTGAPFAGGKNPFASMERIDLFAPGEDASNWKTAEVSIGFDEGVEVFGTPGKERGDPSPQMSSNSSVVSSSFSSSECGQECPRSSIKITEVLLDPADSEDYEWIELGNLGEESVDITGWILSDGARSHVIEPRNSSGYILAPGEHTLFFHYQTGIALSNAGEVITLFDGDQEIDRIDVSETGEEISFGREADGSRGPFCVPSPRKPNHENPLNPLINVQSGRSTDYTKVTLNLEAEVSEGSLKDAQCFWNFDDGTHSEKCNPPSHSWDYYGVYNVELLVTTKCGNEIKRGMDVVVLEKKAPKKSTSSAGVLTRIDQESHSSYISSSSLRAEDPRSVDYEQKSYSTKSSIPLISSISSIISLPIRYKNIPESSDPSNSSNSSTFSFTYRTNEPTNQRTESGLPWVLLFSQSAIWVVLAGKRLL